MFDVTNEVKEKTNKKKTQSICFIMRNYHKIIIELQKIIYP